MPAKTMTIGMVQGVLKPTYVRMAVAKKIKNVILLFMAFLYNNKPALAKNPMAIGWSNTKLFKPLVNSKCVVIIAKEVIKIVAGKIHTNNAKKAREVPPLL